VDAFLNSVQQIRLVTEKFGTMTGELGCFEYLCEVNVIDILVS
jgi:hypothetical protein